MISFPIFILADIIKNNNEYIKIIQETYLLWYYKQKQ